MQWCSFVTCHDRLTGEKHSNFILHEHSSGLNGSPGAGIQILSKQYKINQTASECVYVCLVSQPVYLVSQPVCLFLLADCHTSLEPMVPFLDLASQLWREIFSKAARKKSRTENLSSKLSTAIMYVPLSVCLLQCLLATSACHIATCLPHSPFACLPQFLSAIMFPLSVCHSVSLPPTMSEYSKATDPNHHRNFSSSCFLILVCPRTSHPTHRTEQCMITTHPIQNLPL